MKIVYLIHSIHLAGGMERVLSLKASYLAEIPGYSVHIVTASLKGRTPFFPLSEKVLLTDLGTGDSFFDLLAYKRKLSSLLEEIKPDICISMGGHDIGILPSLKDGSVKMAEFHFAHDKFHRKYGSCHLGKLYARIRIKHFERNARKLERLVVLTREDAEVWSESIHNVMTISNPICFPEEKELRTSDLDSKSVIAVGRLCQQKNYSSMIRAWSKVAMKHPDWHLDIFGAGEHKKELAQLISKSGLDGKIKLMGLSEDIRNEMLKHSVMLMSSSYEGFALVLAEASACGLPLVSYDCYGPSEIIIDGDNGFLVAQGDEEGLADAVCRLIEDDALRHGMGQKSLESSKRFSVSSIMQRWTELFEELCPTD